MWRFIAGASPLAKVQRTSREEESTAATATPRKCCSRWLIANNGEPQQWLKYVDGGSISVEEEQRQNKHSPDCWALARPLHCCRGTVCLPSVFSMRFYVSKTK